MRHIVKITFGNRDKLAELMYLVNPKVAVNTVASLCYGVRKDESEYIDQNGLRDWFTNNGAKVLEKYEFAYTCGCGACSGEIYEYYYYAYFNHNEYTHLFNL